MASKRVMTYVAAGCILLTVVLFGYLIHESQMLSYLSSDPKVCINCHTMNTHYATWQHSSHRERVTCVDCHLPRDSFVKKMFAKSLDGYKHATAMTFKSYNYNLRASASATRRIQDNCISCHRETVSQMQANSALYAKEGDGVAMGRKCWDCHRDIPHARTHNIMAAQYNLGIKGP